MRYELRQGTVTYLFNSLLCLMGVFHMLDMVESRVKVPGIDNMIARRSEQW